MTHIKSFPPLTTVMGYEVYGGALPDPDGPNPEERQCEICGQSKKLRTLIDRIDRQILCIDCYREFVDRED